MVQSFEDIEVNDCTWKAHSDDYYRGFEAGKQSKQAEVDELRKRIDRAVEHIEDYYGVVELSMVVDILNGDQS